MQSGERNNKDGLIIKPQHSTISEFCTDLTSLTREDIDHGITLKEACKIIKEKYNSETLIWSSYGEYDHQMFRKECRSKKVPYPFSSKHIDIKLLFAVLHGLQKSVRMARALNLSGINLEGTHHRGEDDAWNIAALLKNMLMNFRFGTEHNKLK